MPLHRRIESALNPRRATSGRTQPHVQRRPDRRQARTPETRWPGRTLTSERPTTGHARDRTTGTAGAMKPHKSTRRPHEPVPPIRKEPGYGELDTDGRASQDATPPNADADVARNEWRPVSKPREKSPYRGQCPSAKYQLERTETGLPRLYSSKRWSATKRHIDARPRERGGEEQRGPAQPRPPRPRVPPSQRTSPTRSNRRITGSNTDDEARLPHPSTEGHIQPSERVRARVPERLHQENRRGTARRHEEKPVSRTRC